MTLQDPSDAPAEPSKSLVSREAYHHFRSYINDENILINNRVTWILTIHGFLYATYGFTLQKQLEVASKPVHRYLSASQLRVSSACNSYLQTEFFLIVIALVGISISLAGVRSINAATSAIKHVARLYRIQTQAMPFDYRRGIIRTDQFQSNIDRKGIVLCYKIEPGYFVPGITGGGALVNADTGFSAAVSLPLTLIVSWFLSLMLSFWLSNHPIYDRCGHHLSYIIYSIF